MEYSMDDLIVHLAAECYGLLLELNRGSWPNTRKEWERLARRLGIYVVRTQGSFAPCLLDDLAILPDPRNDEEVSRWLVHEIVEAALRSEFAPPMIVPGGCSEVCHRVAQLLEEYA